MIILKYIKKYPASLAGHVDTLRTVSRILRRAKCNVEYSKGFNPHMELLFSPALSLGVESVCEYVALQSADFEALTRLNAVSPIGITFVKWWNVAHVNIASVIDSAQYQVNCQGFGKLSLANLTERFVMTVPSKNGDTQKDVHDKIKSVDIVDDNVVNFTLACGNNNLRCDLLVRALAKANNLDSDYSIIKQQAFVGDIVADQYLDSKCDVSDTLQQ